MSDINARLNSTNLTLQDFKNIAENSSNNAEIRIKKSDGRLSNTPLGFIARNIGFTHSESNNRVTLAFWSTLINDPKYADVSNNIRKTFTKLVKHGSALTPSKINDAIKMADKMLDANNKSQAVTDKVVQNALKNKLVSDDQIETFKKFTQDAAFKHIYAKSDFVEVDKNGSNVSDFIDNEAVFLKKVMVEFYSSKDPDYFTQSNIFGLDAADFGNNKAKAKEADDFLKKLCPDLTGEEAREKVIAYINNKKIATGNENPKNNDSISTLFKKTACLTDPATLSALKVLPKEELAKIEACLIKKGGRPSQTRDILSKILIAVNNFYEANPEFKNVKWEFTKKIPHVVDVITKFVDKTEVISSTTLFALTKELAVDAFIEDMNGFNNMEMVQFCGNMGLDIYSFEALLLEPQTRAAVIDSYDASKGDFYSHIKTKLEEIARENIQFLRQLKGLELNPTRMAHGRAVATYVQRIYQELLKKNPDGTVILENVQATKNYFNKYGILKDEDAAAILKAVTKSMHFLLGFNDQEKIKSPKTQTYVLTLYKDLLEIKKNSTDLTAKDKKNIDEVDELLLALLNLLTADLDESQIVDPASVKPSGNNSELKESLIEQQPETNKKIKRNASDAEIYSAQQAVLHSPELDETKKETAVKLIKLTRCADIDFIKKFVDVNDSFEGMLQVFKSDSQQRLNEVLLQFKQFGRNLSETETLLSNYSKNDIIDFFLEVLVATCSQKDMENLYAGLRDQYTKTLLEMLNTLQIKEKNTDTATLDVKSFTKENDIRIVDELLSNINKLGDKLAAKLNIQNPQPIFDPEAKKYPEEIPFQDNLPDTIGGLFRFTHRDFDKAMLGNNSLSQEKKEAVKEFVYSLKVPVSDKEPLKNAGAYGENQVFEFTYTNENGETVAGNWMLKDMMHLMGAKAKEISELLEQNEGKPTPQQLWGIIHGGQTPANLSFDNFLNTLAVQYIKEIDALGKILGKKSFEPFLVFGTLRLVGVNITDYIKKLSKADKEDIVFDAADQKNGEGMFCKDCIIGLNYKNGSENYGFGLDFHRAKAPEGVTSDEGCKITLQTGNNEKVFTQKESWASGTKEGSVQYIKNMASEIREKLGNISDKQLAGVGFCITQGIQSVLRQAPVLYFKVSSHFEHTALDHTIKKLDNGKIQVIVNEKPGTAFFKFHVVMEVDENGVVNTTEGKITLASMEKIQNYKKDHPEVAV